MKMRMKIKNDNKNDDKKIFFVAVMITNVLTLFIYYKVL